MVGFGAGESAESAVTSASDCGDAWALFSERFQAVAHFSPHASLFLWQGSELANCTTAAHTDSESASFASSGVGGLLDGLSACALTCRHAKREPKGGWDLWEGTSAGPFAAALRGFGR
jgi:hypothetical protein